MKDDWYKFLTPEFRLNKSVIKSRDRVVVSCTICGTTNFVLVSNLKKLVARRGVYSCFSCNAKIAANGRPPRTKPTNPKVLQYVQRYGGVVSGHISTNSEAEFLCVNCSSIVKRGLKNLIRKGIPPRCDKCTNHAQNRGYREGLVLAAREKLRGILSQWLKSDDVSRALKSYDYRKKTAEVPCPYCGNFRTIHTSNLFRDGSPSSCKTCSYKADKRGRATYVRYLEKLRSYLERYQQDPLPEGYVPSTTFLTLKCNGCGTRVRKTPNFIMTHLQNPIRCRSCGGKAGDTEVSREKYKKTNLEKYGVVNPQSHPDIKRRAWEAFRKKNVPKNSKLEASIIEFLQSKGVQNIVRHDRDLLSGLEVDILIPEKNLGIDPGALFWHSEKANKPTDVHFKKRARADAKGVVLFQIFHSEWRDKPKVVKSMISHRLGLSERVSAKKTFLKELPLDQANTFLNSSHLEDFDDCSSALGLCSKLTGDILAVMTYSTLEDGTIKLGRYASLPGIVVVGGFSKLLAFFKGRTLLAEIDLRYSNPSVLKQFGFQEIELRMNHYWTDFKKLHPEYSEGLIRIWGAGKLLLKRTP